MFFYFFYGSLGASTSMSEGSTPSLCPWMSVRVGVPDQIVSLRSAIPNSDVLIWERSMNEGRGGAEYNCEGIFADSVGWWERGDRDLSWVEDM